MECHISGERGSRKLLQRQVGFYHRTLLTLPPGATSSIMLKILFTVFALTCTFTPISACNIDTTRPVLYTPPGEDSGFGDYSDGLFGYTVLQHKASLDNYVLVGAPTANSYYLSFNEPVERPGVLFHCLSLSPYSCFEINLDESGNVDPVGPELKNMKDNAWIGASLTRQPTKDNDDLSDITVCGHRYANDYFVQYVDDTLNTTFDPNDRFPNGICYSFGHRNGDIDAGRSDGVQISIPCAGENQTNGINTRVHGWCQAGMSAQYTSDGNRIMLGAAGSYNWTGTVFQGDQVDLDFKPAADAWGEDNDYIGYAVTSGKFLSRDTVQGVTSAPRALRRQKEITEGKVIIYDLDTHEIYQELYGEMMSTYYGAAITALDLNNDGWSDLLVGAPLYATVQDEGRVYVYINNGKGKVEPLDFKLSGNDAFGARFGSAIAGAGNLNADNYEDVIIGAPWEDDNSGAVYVYFGAANGIQRTYSQRLTGKDFGAPGLKSFGISLDGGTDLDLNGLPDIVAGAAASETVILFKTRPVANMQVWLIMDPDPMDPEIQNCALDGKPITCVNVSVCFYYKAVSTPTSMDMDIELTVDYFRTNDGLSGRFYFMEDGSPAKSFYRLVKALYDETVCYPYFAYLQKNTQDFLTPLSFHLYYGIHEYPFEEDPRGDNPDKFVGGLPPIIDEDVCGNGTKIDELRFIQDCGADAICQTDLQLTGEVEFPGGDPYFTLGSYSTMRVQFQVDNVGEEAHNAQVVVRHSKEIVFEALEESQSTCLTDDSDSAADSSCNLDVVVTCVPVQAQNDSSAVECTLGNPMKSSTSSFLRLRFDVGAVTYEHSQGFLNVVVEARTISTELNPSNNIFKPRIPVKVEADTAVRGRSEPAAVYYVTNMTHTIDPDLALMEALVAAGVIPYDNIGDMKSEYEVVEVILNSTEEMIINEESIGPPFSLLFEAPNLGPGRLPFDSVLYISIPWRLSNGDWLIYLQNVRMSGVAGTCNDKQALKLQEFRLEEHYVNKTSSPDTDLEKGYTIANGVETSKNSKQLACSNAKCVTIKCSIPGPILSGDSFVVEIDALLWVPTFIEYELYKRYKEVVSSSAIVVDDPAGDHGQPEDDEPDHYDLATGIFTDTPPSEPIAWWIIFLSVLGGILLLVLIIFILYKVGFFKRQTKDELEKLQQAQSL